ncbi:MAG: hypothetical protein H7Y20_09710, partial [Bryobacteraceae bacterium]|nr:hypothetical protein [Bryobacteraceae bacterium]
LELSLTWSPKAWLRVQNNLSTLQLDVRTLATNFAAAETYLAATSPDYQNNTRISLNLPRRFEVDVSLYSHSALVGLKLPAAVRVDSRLAWRYSPQLEFSLTGQDLGSPTHPEFFAEGFTQSAVPRRRIFGQVKWSF